MLGCIGDVARLGTNNTKFQVEITVVNYTYEHQIDGKSMIISHRDHWFTMKENLMKC